MIGVDPTAAAAATAVLAMTCLRNNNACLTFTCQYKHIMHDITIKNIVKMIIGII